MKTKTRLKRKFARAKEFTKKLAIEVLIFAGIIASLNFGIDRLQGKPWTTTTTIQIATSEPAQAKTAETGQVDAIEAENTPESSFEGLAVVEKEPVWENEARFTSYNAEVGQTDSDPFTMASGKRVYEGAVANNCLPFGTKVKVEGLGILTVEDRMNSRYDCDHFDIFKWERKDNITKNLNYKTI